MRDPKAAVALTLLSAFILIAVLAPVIAPYSENEQNPRATLGPGTTSVMIAIGLNSFPISALLIRGQTLSIKERDYVTAARTLGAHDRAILYRHILPNTI